MSEKRGLSALGTLGAWCRARALALLAFGLCTGAIFLVYGLYGLEWDIPRYTALVCTAIAGVLAAIDFVRFAKRCVQLNKLAGQFPAGGLPPARTLPERQVAGIIEALEAERKRLVDEAERRDREAGEYYTLWVHQIKVPIAGLRLLLQQKNTLPAPQRAALEAELLRIEQYVGMALQYQRLASLNADLAFEPHSLERLAKQAVKGLAPLFILKNLPVEVEALPGEVVTDAKWLGFVLEQVLSNALKYTNEGRVRIYSPKAHLVCIEDTGLGIRAEDLPRVFERGFTGHTGREDARATGLGLYLCHEIMRRLGFGIGIESTPGKGTRVTLDLRQSRLAAD